MPYGQLLLFFSIAQFTSFSMVEMCNIGLNLFEIFVVMSCFPYRIVQNENETGLIYKR
jgi:hypothetical protein